MIAMSSDGEVRPLRVLLVEDNPADVMLFREAIHEHRILNDLTVLADGEAAIAYVRGDGEFAGAPRPDLVLLDLNLPLLDGREVLARIKGDPATSTIPVVVMTSSRAETDIARSYELQANCYVTKPLDFEQFMFVVRSIETFWLTIVQLPPHE
jgi:two-component system, chemotaxis family, response regulator Rcp1